MNPLTIPVGLVLATLAGLATAQWRPLFNGENLDGWKAKIRGHDLGDNFANTFRIVDGLLTVSYDGYESFDRRFGHLFHETEFSSYRLRAEYRFIGEQSPGGPGWAFRNSGLMIHGQPAESMAKDQEFPVSIEVQLLGGREQGERTTSNLCTPGTNVVMDGKLVRRHCTDSSSKTYRGDEWVTVVVEVRGNRIRHLIDGDVVLVYEDPQLDDRDEDAKQLLATGHGPILERGSISLQSESHPIQFRRVEILELGEPGGWIEPLKGKLSEHWVTKGNWEVVDGFATLTPREGERGWRRFDHYLWLEGEYADFEAEFDYKVTPRGNSGFYFHVGDTSNPVETGLEVQIFASHGKDGALTDHDSGGMIPGNPPTTNAAKPTSEWNRMHVLSEDGFVAVTLNGKLVNRMSLGHEKLAGRPAKGAIGFQDHSLPLALRSFRIRRL